MEESIMTQTKTLKLKSFTSHAWEDKTTLVIEKRSLETIYKIKMDSSMKYGAEETLILGNNKTLLILIVE